MADCQDVLQQCSQPHWCSSLYLATLLTLVFFVLNHLATESLHYCTPMEVLIGSTPDISPIL